MILSREEVTALMNKQCGQSINYSKQKEKHKGAELVENGEYDKVTHREWYLYFVKKAKENKVDYLSGSNLKIKEYAVLKSLVASYQPALIKAMIDYVWEGQHKVMPRNEINIFILSKGFLRSVVPNAEEWLKGNRKYCVECDPRLRIENNKKLEEGGVWIAGVRIC